MNVITQFVIPVIAAYFVTICFSMLFNNSFIQSIHSGAVGGFGWLFYLVALEFNPSVVIASFVAALVVSITSFFLSKIRKAPITIFQIPGIIPLVPGMGMYKTLSAVIANDYVNANIQLMTTVQIAGAIAVAMMLVFSISSIIEQQIRAKSMYR